MDLRDSQPLVLKEMPPELVPWDVTFHRIKDELTHPHRHVCIDPDFEHVGCPVERRETRSDFPVAAMWGGGLSRRIERAGSDVRANVRVEGDVWCVIVCGRERGGSQRTVGVIGKILHLRRKAVGDGFTEEERVKKERGKQTFGRVGGVCV
jgi:hypothetical protein